MKYRAGYKYVLDENICVMTSVMPRTAVAMDHITLFQNGKICIEAGYAWDGASGPVPDTKWNMTASLVHDALYQLLRRDLLAYHFKEAVDSTFRELCISGGVPKCLAWTYYKALQKFGHKAASRSAIKQVYHAP